MSSFRNLPFNELLELRICDLDLNLHSSPYAKCLDRLYRELELKGLSIRPKFWVSDEWFCPNGISGIAIPFYLLDPRLIELENFFMGEAEGQSEQEFMKLLRHECGHAIDHAYFTQECEQRVSLFGDHTKRYPSSYDTKKYSRNYVHHLSQGYAQAHPEEDWAETFAVWLDPRSRWRKVYSTWPAIKKLNYMSRKMRQLKGSPVHIVCYKEIDQYKENNLTLKEYYRLKLKRFKKTKRVSLKHISKYITDNEYAPNLGMELRRNRQIMIRKVARATNQYQYRIESIIKDLEDIALRKDIRVINHRSRLRKEKTLEAIIIGHTKKYLGQKKHKVIM